MTVSGILMGVAAAASALLATGWLAASARRRRAAVPVRARRARREALR